jgi:histidine ammonia-lyase
LELSPAGRARLEQGVLLLERHLAAGVELYGVTTGFGASAQNLVDPGQRTALAHNLVQYHGCGSGPHFEPELCRAIVLARLACLSNGHSAVRPAVVERLIWLLNHDLVPAIPAWGSVGASGDLTPLSYVAAAVMGEREVYVAGKLEPLLPHLGRHGLQPLELHPKESLSLMNGTSAMTGLGCLALERTRRLARWCSTLSALCCDAIAGHVEHFNARLFELKPHPGQAHVAAWIRREARAVSAVATDTGATSAANASTQDRYSLRCAPHIIGVLVDFLPVARQWLETELNSVNDNPVLDGSEIYHGGHFYGGHVCLAMDTLKIQVANLVDLVDRQLMLVCDPQTSRGLPTNLVPVGLQPIHHGFKAMQIACSALAAEAAKAAIPASVFSRSTENHNQDKVSLGTIAARDCLALLDLSETAAAIATLTLARACELRGLSECGPGAQRLCSYVRQHTAPVTGDRRLDLDIQRIRSEHTGGRLPIGEVDCD